MIFGGTKTKREKEVASISKWVYVSKNNTSSFKKFGFVDK